MARVLQLRPAPPPVPRPAPISDFERLPESKRRLAEARMYLVRSVLALKSECGSERAAMLRLKAMFEAGVLHDGAAQLVALCRGRFPSTATINRFVSAYESGGLMALVDNHKGRQFSEEPWRPMLAEMLKVPPKRCLSTYWEKLVAMGFSCTYRQVCHYYNALPADVREPRAQLGPHNYRQNYTPHVIRDRLSIEPGRIWEGDGHQFHFYAAHPATGRKHRFEITWWIDIGSYYPIGYWISESESATTTLHSLARCMKDHDHVPDLIHVDPGPGFYNKLICDEVTGFSAHVGFAVQFALPGNARGKGNVEGSFRWFEEKVGKDAGLAYVGEDMPQEYCRTVEKRIDSGEIRLWSLQEVRDRIDEYFAKWRTKPREEFDGLTAAQMWDRRERNPLMMSVDHILEGRRIARVTKRRVQFWNRVYEHGELERYRGENVALHFDFENLTSVRVRTLDGRLICTAELVKKRKWITDSRSDDLRMLREQGQHKRKLKQMEDQSERARPVISGVPIADAPDALTSSMTPAEQRIAQGHSLIAVVESSAAKVTTTVAHDEAARVSRCERAVALLAQRERGEPLAEADAAWVDRYARTVEFRAHQRFLNSFGTADFIRRDHV